MSKIQKKFISSDAVDQTKIRLDNDGYLRARNAAGTADVNILKVNASDKVEFAVLPQCAISPSSSVDLVNKAYIDNVIAGIKWKEPVRAATTANVTLAAPGSIDGVSLAEGDRVLVKDQTTASENGIYVLTSGSLVRASDADTGSEIKQMAVFVEEGTVNADKGFVCVTDGTITVGSSAIAFVQFSASNAYSAGQGIAIASNVISVDLAATPALEFNANKLQVQVASNGAVERTASGLAVKLEATDPSLRINGANELGVKIATGSALASDATGLKVDIETASMEIVSNKLQPKLAASNSALDKASGLAVKVDGITVKVNASNQLESVKCKQEIISITATEVANGYVDLAQTAYSADCVAISPKGGPVQEQGADYTVTVSGPNAGRTRITFAGDLLELASGDKLIVRYEYL